VSLEEKLELLEDIMDYDDALKPEMVLADLEEWDSLSTLALAAKVRELYGTNLTSDQILQFETVQDICDYLK
jgi:acyl carrier protein